MTKKFEIWQPLLIALAMALGVLIGLRLYNEVPSEQLISKRKAKHTNSDLEKVLALIKSEYGLPQSETVDKNAIDAIVKSLDPHSYYLTKEDYRYYKLKTEGSYNGIGIEYEIFYDSVYITSVNPNSPAAEKGVRIGDCLTHINGYSIYESKLDENKLKQAWSLQDDTIRLDIFRPFEDSYLQLDIPKKIIDVNNVQAYFMLNDNTAYFELFKFSVGSYKEFMESLEDLYSPELKNLIIDLRNNSGGSLRDAIKLAAQFIPQKKVSIAKTIDGHGDEVDYKSSGQIFFPVENVLILMNQYTASAAELLAGSLQDLGLATIIGTRSFGKSLVQEIFPISDSSAISLTVSEFILPSGRSIQKPFDSKEDYKHEITSRVEAGEIFNENIVPSDSMVYSAYLGRNLPVHFGISPDFKMAYDSSQYYWIKKYRQELAVAAFAIYKTIKDFPEDGTTFAWPSEEFANRRYLQLLADSGVNADNKKLADFVKTQLVETIVYLKYGQDTYSKFAIPRDEWVKTALEIISKPSLTKVE